MCGVFLVYSKNKKLDNKSCFKSIKSLQRRGPDKSKFKFFLENRLFIFNSILSITGKIDNSSEIYKSRSKKYFLSYNGEIYNHRELSKEYFGNSDFFKNDSELLINLFDKINNKVQIPKIINGMFSFVVYEKKKERLFFSSDVQGEKRLYKYEDENCFVLSSTINSILQYVKKIDLDHNKIKEYFYTRHLLLLKNTIYKNIEVLEPGNFFEYNLKTFNLKRKKFENPLDWIDENEHNRFNKMSEEDLIEYFHFLLKDQLKLMIPEVKFGSIASGGIDSTLQTRMISSFNKNFSVATIHHEGKDNITKNINLFNDYIGKKIQVYNANPKKNYFFSKKCIEEISIPFLTHDFVGRYQISNYFKKKKCKVFFCGDGADEIFGGYELYNSNIWNKKKVVNQSPYSTLNKNNNKLKYLNSTKKKLNQIFSNAAERYNFLNFYDRNIQSSLYSDYFTTTASVYNIGTDLVGCNNSIEPRNVFIQKNILKNAMNLPAKYKINLNSTDKNFILKPLLKKIFLKYFPKKLIYKKQGFSGFPNEMRKFLAHQDFNKLYKLLKSNRNNDNMHYSREEEWKLVNLELYLENFSSKNIL